jgi:hypothetical protein
VTVTVIVSPIVTGRAKCTVDSMSTVPGPGELGAEGGRHQRGGPHAVRDEILKQAAVPELGVGQRGIHVAGHQREELDVLRAQGADQ